MRPHRLLQCLTLSFVGVTLLSLGISPPARGGIAAELVVAPPLITPIGEMRCSVFWDINERGQATGDANPCLSTVSAAVRFSATGGLEDLDPDGEYRSTGFSINRRGTVLGFVKGGSVFYVESFLHRPGSGFDFLGKGKTDVIRKGFFPGFYTRQGLPRSEAIFGTVLYLEEGAARPHLYTKRKGWVNLSHLHPRFAEETTAGVYMNDAGYQVFVVVGVPPPGEEPPTGRQEYFVRSPDGTLTQVVSPGRPVMPAGRPNRKGRMAGLYLTDDARERAYVWTPRTGLVDIHPDGFRSSFALGTNKRGESFGALERKREHTDVFVHTKQNGLEVVISRDDLVELVRKRRGTLKDVYPWDINDRGEIVGCVGVKRGREFSFYYSPSRGLFGIDELLDGLGSEFGERECSARFINNRGQILFTSLSNGARSAGAILTLAD